MERILVVQLSDIHVGSVRNGFYDSSSLRAGYNGHDPLLMRRLCKDIRRLRSSLKLGANERLNFVVSGDLSCTGLRADFSQAYTYLLREIIPDSPEGGAAGLQIPSELLWTVPGNHDHWNGRHPWPQPAHDRTLFPDYCEKTPWRAVLQSTVGTLRLELFGVDSNSGLSSWSSNTNARGRLSRAELSGPPGRGLETLLTESHRDEQSLRGSGTRVVRAVVCHHSFSNHGRPDPDSPPPSRWASSKTRIMTWCVGKCPDPLVKEDVEALKSLCRRFGVTVVMTGHTHYFSEERDPADRNAAGPCIWELRCSTTLQGPAADAVQGFYLHEILLGDDPTAKPVWRFKRYQYTVNRFEPQSDWSTLW